jgi:catechol 2,3-dioxygenase-like lactoylglutathione lyase family enzyme
LNLEGLDFSPHNLLSHPSKEAWGADWLVWEMKLCFNVEDVLLQNLKLEKIGVIMLGVRDLEASVAFYQEKLGLALQSKIPGEFAFFAAGTVTLALSVPHGKNRPNLAGATEVVFSVDGVTEAYDALRSRDIAFTQAPRNVTGTMWSANFTDPDGHQLAIFGPERRAA